MASGEMALVNPPHPVALEESREVERIEEKEQAVLMVGFAGVDIYSEDAVALEMIEEACSDLGSRLFLRIREEMGLAYFVGSSQLIGLVRGSFTFYLGTAPEKVEEVKLALHEEIAKLAAAGLTAEEFARSREKSLGQMEFRIQSNSALASQAAVSELYGLGYDHHLRERAEIEGLTLERLNSVARQYLERASITAIVRPMGGESLGII
jgi:zinc protease